MKKISKREQEAILKARRKHKSDYNKIWSKKNNKRVGFNIKKEEEKDLIEFLNTKESQNSYLKDLIRKDMESQKNLLSEDSEDK